MSPSHTTSSSHGVWHSLLMSLPPHASPADRGWSTFVPHVVQKAFSSGAGYPQVNVRWTVGGTDSYLGEKVDKEAPFHPRPCPAE